jgi:hypothetical protein
MKCEDCLPLLEEYIDGELKQTEVATISSHLVTCNACSGEFDLLTAEQDVYARYDRELTIPPPMWNEIAGRTVAVAQPVESKSQFSLRGWFALPSFRWSFAGALALVLLAAAMGMVYLRTTKKSPDFEAKKGIGKPEQPKEPTVPREKKPAPIPGPIDETQKIAGVGPKIQRRNSTQANRERVAAKAAAGDQSDVLFSDVALSAAEERETATHIEQAQNLLRSVRNIEGSDDNSDVDVTYEKALSRRLLNENVVLRREAEMRGRFPTKVLLADLEPFLIDIANLPDKAAPNDLRVLKDRVLKTEIVAALQAY